MRQCQGLLAVWALEDIPEGRGFALVPSSHLSDVEPPPHLNSGGDLAAPLSVVLQPAMKAGDLLLVAEATMHGLPSDAAAAAPQVSTAPPSASSSHPSRSPA